MKRQILQTKLLMIFTIALTGTAAHSRATAQISSALDFRAIPLAETIKPSTASTVADDVCEQRLLKALDALEKAEKALGAAINEIEARKRLDALKDELLAAKDQYIADVLADNKFLRNKLEGPKSKLRKVFERIEKILLLGAGIYIGKGI